MARTAALRARPEGVDLSAKRLVAPPLQYPEACPPLASADDMIAAFALAFLPSLARGEAEAADLQVQHARNELTGNAWQWFPVWRKVTNDYAREAVAAHLAAGETGIPWRLTGEGEIRALGAGFRNDDERTWIVNVDLDGKYDPGRVLAALVALDMAPLVVSSSGRRGRFRALFKLDRWYTMLELRDRGRELFRGLGFEVQRGAVELYPCRGNGRLPFGLGGCNRYDWTNLDGDGTRETPAALLRAVYELPPVALDELAARFRARGKASSAPRAVPTRQPEARHKPRAKVDTPPDVERWLAHGVEPGERQAALARLAEHAWFRGQTSQEAAESLSEWIQRGGIARSRFMAETPNAIERQIRDVPRIVRNIYRICATFKPSAVNAPPAHLSAADVLLVAPHVERAAKETGITAKRAGAFVHAILPRFKGAKVAGRVDALGRPLVRIHHDDWREAAGDGPDYARLRDALGLFEAVTGYLPAKRAARVEDAYARTYALTVELTDDAPRRPLGSTWGLSVVAAQKVRRRGARPGKPTENIGECWDLPPASDPTPSSSPQR